MPHDKFNKFEEAAIKLMRQNQQPYDKSLTDAEYIHHKEISYSDIDNAAYEMEEIYNKLKTLKAAGLIDIIIKDIV